MWCRTYGWLSSAFGKTIEEYRNVVHDPVKNYYRFQLEKKYVLVPLPKEQVQQDVDGLKGQVKS